MMADGSAFAPSLGTTSKRTGRPAGRLYDCGKFGRLSAPQIAHIAGISDTAARLRIANGWTGEKLCQPRGERPGAQKGVARSTQLAALRVAMAFPHRIPTVAELCRVQPMSPGSAERWLRAFRQVRAERGGCQT